MLSDPASVRKQRRRGGTPAAHRRTGKRTEPRSARGRSGGRV